MKRMMILLLCTLVLMMLVPTSAVRAEISNWLEIENADGEITIVGCDPSASGELVIPDEFRGGVVVAIAENAFQYCYDITGITISATVTDIATNAFSDCWNLAAINVDADNPVYSSDDKGVLYNKNQTQLLCVPPAIQEGYSIADGTLHIGDMAFKGCSGLRVIDIPESVQTIGSFAFENCFDMDTVNIGTNITSIGQGAFAGCSSLDGIWVNDANAYYINDEYGALYTKDQSLLLQVPASIFDGYSVPECVTTVGDGAFQGCYNLTSVNLPDNVTTIGDQAFLDCFSLTSITLPEGLTEMGDEVFCGCSDLMSVTIPDQVSRIGNYAFSKCTTLTTVILPSSALEIGEYAFYLCENLNNITIPAGVTSIGERAFQQCYALTGMDIPDSVTALGDFAFIDCSALQSVTLGNGLQVIEKGTFEYCRSLTELIIPDGVTAIKDDAFMDCSGLTTVTLSNQLKEIGYYAFYGCSSLRELTIPENVSYIGSVAFCCDLSTDPSGNSQPECGGLTSIRFLGDLPEGVLFFGCPQGTWAGGGTCAAEHTITVYYPVNNPTWVQSAMNTFDADCYNLRFDWQPEGEPAPREPATEEPTEQPTEASTQPPIHSQVQPVKNTTDIQSFLLGGGIGVVLFAAVVFIIVLIRKKR